MFFWKYPVTLTELACFLKVSERPAQCRRTEACPVTRRGLLDSDCHPRHVSGYAGSVPLEMGRVGAPRVALRAAAIDEFSLRRKVVDAEAGGCHQWRSEADMAELRDLVRRRDSYRTRAAPLPTRTKRWSLSGYELELSTVRGAGAVTDPPKKPYHRYRTAADWITATDNLMKSKDRRTKKVPESRPFDPYNVIPNLEPYRYPLHSLREYYKAIRRKGTFLLGEDDTLFNKPTLEKDNSLIHRYYTHVSHPRKILNYPARLSTEIQYGTHPQNLKPHQKVRLIDKVDFRIDI